VYKSLRGETRPKISKPWPLDPKGQHIGILSSQSVQKVRLIAHELMCISQHKTPVDPPPQGSLLGAGEFTHGDCCWGFPVEATVTSRKLVSLPLVDLSTFAHRKEGALFYSKVDDMGNPKSSTGISRKQPSGKPFPKGVSGNPSGRPKLPEDVKHVRELARQYTQTAISTLASVMEDGSSAARVAAAQAMMDRGWGKAEQPITGADGGAVKFEVTGLSWLQQSIQDRNGG